MIRIRRYRIFAAVAIFFVLGLFYLSDAQTWRRSFTRGSSTAQAPLSQTKDTAPAPARPPPTTPIIGVDTDPVTKPAFPSDDDARPEGFPQINLPGSKSDKVDDKDKPSLPGSAADNFPGSSKDTKASSKSGSHETAPSKTQVDKTKTDSLPASNGTDNDLSKPTTIYWTHVDEHFPVPSSSLIPLPTAKPKKIPKVQSDFEKENVIDRKGREKKLDRIKEVFMKHWDGYKKYAWDHDELLPVSGSFKDPFAGWRATLVDTLDTLWIMGLKEEFEEAVNATSQIEFKTTPRDSLPVFEVTIRYMGGLLAAYDISEHQYPVLLDKAKELGEVLIGVFDTPNRMPMTYYRWQP